MTRSEGLPRGIEQVVAQTSRWRRRLAIGLGIFTLSSPLFVAVSPALTPMTLAIMVGIVALAAWGPRVVGAPGPTLGAERLIYGPLLAFGTAFILGLTHLRGTDVTETLATLPLLLLLVGIVTLLIGYVAPAQPASLSVLVALTILLALAMPRRAIVADALASGLHSSALWVTVGGVVVGIVVLALLERRLSIPSRRWPLLLVYVVVSLSLAGWWRWGAPVDQLSVLPSSFERATVQSVPIAILAGTCAHLAIALLLRPDGMARRLAADLAAHLLLIGLIVGAPIVAQRPATAIEKQFNISWLALVPIVLVAIRAALVLNLLRRVAQDARVGERRVALALWIICCAVYWPAGQWRYATHNLTGDETQYIATTISLVRDRSLDPTNFLLDPNNGMASRLGYRQIDIYEDQSRDRMVFGIPAKTGTTFYLPVVGGEELEATIQLLNSGIEPTSATIAIRTDDGRESSTTTIPVPSGGTAFFPVPPVAGASLSAIVTGGQPIAVSARLRDRSQGDEIYSGMVALPRSCIPVHPADRGWRSELLVQNPLSRNVRVTWQYYNAEGVTPNAIQELTLPPHGTAGLPMALLPDLGTLCVIGDSPIASLLLVRASPGLLVQQGQSTQSGQITIPEPPRGFATSATSEVLVYNPSSQPAQVTFSTLPAPVTIPPRGTRGVVISGGVPVSGQTADQIDTTWVLTEESVVLTFLATTGGQWAAVTPNARAANSLTIPVIAGGTDRNILGHLQLTNRSPVATMATAVLRGPAGQTIWQDKLWVCANCIITHPFWYRDPTGGVLTIQAREPLAATLLQREVIPSWPTHGIGASLIAVPAYVAAGWGGILAFFGMVAATLVTAFYGLLRDVSISRRTSILIAALLAWSAPLVSYGAQFYPETSATLLLLIALRLSGAKRLGWPQLLGILLCLGLVPLFHARLLPLSLILFATSSVRLLLQIRGRAVRANANANMDPPNRWRYALWVGAAAMLVTALLAILSRDTRLQPAFLFNYFSNTQVVPHTLGILFDNATGLLPCLPLLLIVGSGYSWAIRRAPYLGLTALALGAVQLLFVALRRSGWELWGPPGRYILPALPFFALALGACWERGFHRPIKPIVLLLTAWGLVFGAFYTWVPAGSYFVPSPYYWFADDILKALLGVNPLRVFPRIPANSVLTTRLMLILIGVLITGVLLGGYWRFSCLRLVSTRKVFAKANTDTGR